MDNLTASASLPGQSIDVTLTVVSDATTPARRVTRRRLSFPAAADDGLLVADISDLFTPGTPPVPWADVERQRYLVVNSISEGGLLQAEVATYVPHGSIQPTRVVVRIDRPSSVWQSGTAYATAALVIPTPGGGYGYQCMTAGTSGTASPSFPTAAGATVTDGTVVWTCVGPTTPSWTLEVVDIEAVTRVVASAGVTEIFTSASATSPAGTVTVAAGQFTWAPAGQAGLTVGFDLEELQSTISTVDPTHPNHVVFATGVGAAWQPITEYEPGALVQPTAPPTGSYYRCTTGGTSGPGQPVFPTTAGAIVADGTAVWTWVGPAVVFRNIIFDQSFDPNTGAWTRRIRIADHEADSRTPGPPAAALKDGTTYYYGSFLSQASIWQAATAYPAGSLLTPNPANGFGYQCTTAGTSAATAPAFGTATGAMVADGTAVWICLGPNPTTASAMATGAHGYGNRTYALLPEADRYFDEPTPDLEGGGQLRRFVQVFGAGLDQARSLGQGLLSLHDVLHVDAAYLSRLARWIGWDPNLTQPESLQRSDILFAPEIFASVGTIPTLGALVNRMSGWTCQVKEFVDNVFLTNSVEQVRLWQVFEATSTGAAAGFSAPAPQANVYPLASEPAVTQQDPNAFDARPAAVIDSAGTVWLVWHSHRLGSEWQASTAYTASSLLAPSASNGRQYRCTTAGTSAAAEPVFPQTAGATVTDGTAVWTCVGTGVARRRIWFQRLSVDPTPINAVGDLADDPSFVDEAPAALFDGTHVWIFWSSNRTGTADIWGRMITAGNPPMLAPPVPLTEEGVGDQNPSAVRDSTGRILVFWESSRRGPSDVWTVTSTNDGASWSAASRVSTGNPSDHTPTAVLDSANNVRIFYSSDTGDGRKIRQGVLTDTTWTFSDVTMPVPGFRDEAPAAAVWNGAIWLFWHSNRFGSIWAPGTAYTVGADVIPALGNGFYYQCIKAGTSGAVSPTFPTVTGASVADGSVVWVCVGALATAGMANRFRIWSASATGINFGAPASVLPRLSNDQQPAALVDHSGELHLYFASQEAGARFRSRTVDTSVTPTTGRTQIANKLALATMRAYSDRLHYTYDTRYTTNPAHSGGAAVYARDTVGVYLTPGDGLTDAQHLQTTARVRALVAPFQPLPVQLIWYVKQSNGTFAASFADVGHTLLNGAPGT
jgi:hypothetical protein